jgi:hypothetical protein
MKQTIHVCHRVIIYVKTPSKYSTQHHNLSVIQECFHDPTFTNVFFLFPFSQIYQRHLAILFISGSNIFYIRVRLK